MKKSQKTKSEPPEQENFLAQLEPVKGPAVPEPPAERLNSELIIAFVAAVGVNLDPAETAAEIKLKELGYKIERIRVTKDVLPLIDSRASQVFSSDFERINRMMDVGTEARKQHGNQIVALGIAAAIAKRRAKNRTPERTAYLVHSLKHPEEARKLREIYPRGFYLIGLHSPGETRIRHLCSRKGIDKELAEKLIKRDRKEGQEFGQQLVDTFHLADFFSGWRFENSPEKDQKFDALLKNSIARFIDVLFGHPNITPTFGEYAMFLAFSAALRSADLSRQVGAVIARDGEILATGANDCPKFGGGLYWPILDKEKLEFVDFKDGRDYTRGKDPNKSEQTEIIRFIIGKYRQPLQELLANKLKTAHSDEEIEDLHRNLLRGAFEILRTSQIRDLTEFGRVVHAEMEALLSCARKGISTKGATLYSTTFPCHNCAKHIIAAGIKRVVFIEPYLKSRALSFHDEAVMIHYPDILGDEASRVEKVTFEPFWGVGPRRFFDLFSLDMSAGYPIIRKNPKGQALTFDVSNADLRIQMSRHSYLEQEHDAAQIFENTFPDALKENPV